MAISILTICSNRKRFPVEEGMQGQNFASKELKTTADNWIRDRQKALHKVRAEDLYCGRGFAEARKSAHHSGADLWVISAGFGLIRSSSKIAPYDLTIAPGAINSLDNLVPKGQVCLTKWWSYINRGKTVRTIRALVETAPSNTFVMTLTSRYLEMIKEDLLKMSDSNLKRVRIVGPPLSAISDERLKMVYLPYDERLEAVGPPYAGTRSDFPQRAGRHFVEKIWQPKLSNSIRVHQKRVLNSLVGRKRPVIPSRRKLDDESIRKLIGEHWKVTQGRSGWALRFFRDNLGVACEQGRFKHLFNEIKEKMV
jgi:hypothetical protein